VVSVSRGRVPRDDDPILTTMRAALTNDTVGSFKKSICACLIILTTGLFLRPRGRLWLPALVVSLGLAARSYWHTFLGLL
jgi:hypothetical protein